MRVSHSVVVARPLDDVWSFMADIAANETRWQPDIESVDFEGEPELAAGAIFVETRRSFGRLYVWRFRISDVVEGQAYTIESISGKPALCGTRSFRSIDGSTEITEASEITLHPLMELVAPLLRPIAESRLRDAYARLKALLESQPAATG